LTGAMKISASVINICLVMFPPGQVNDQLPTSLFAFPSRPWQRGHQRREVRASV
jgi:hypothetical protein